MESVMADPDIDALAAEFGGASTDTGKTRVVITPSGIKKPQQEPDIDSLAAEFGGEDLQKLYKSEIAVPKGFTGTSPTKTGWLRDWTRTFRCSRYCYGNRS